MAITNVRAIITKLRRRSRCVDGMPNTKAAYEWLALPLRDQEVSLSNILSIVTEMFVVYLIAFRENRGEKFTLQQATKAQTGSTAIALLFL